MTIEQRIYCPGAIISFGFSFLSFMAYLQLFDVYEVSSFGYTLVVLFVGMYTLGGLLVRVLYKKTFKIKMGDRIIFQPQNNKPIVIDKRIIDVCIILAFLYFLVKAFQAIRLMRSGYDLFSIRLMFSSSGEESELMSAGFESYFLFYLARPAMYLVMSVGIVEFFSSEGNNKKILLIFLVILILNMITSGGRTLVAFFAVLFIFTYKIYKQDITFANSEYLFLTIKKFKRTIRFVVIFMILSIAAITVLRKNSVVNYFFWRRAYIYTGCIIPYMDAMVREYNLPNTNGLAFWLGLIRIPRAIILKLFGLPYSNAYIVLTQQIPIIKHAGKLVSPLIAMNGFPTAIFYFFADFGVPGVAMESFLFALFSFPFYYSLKCNCNKKTIASFLLAEACVFEALLENPVTFAYIMAIILVNFVYRYSTKKTTENL